MENLTVTLDTAKKLKAAGFPQDSYLKWSWSFGEDVGDGAPLEAHLLPMSTEIEDEYNVEAAPTAQEIADQLAWGVHSTQLTLLKREDDKYAASYAAFNGSADFVEVAPTLAEALAALWLKLQEAK